jgi:hypothetical protein
MAYFWKALELISHLKSWTKHNLILSAPLNISLRRLCPRPPNPNRGLEPSFYTFARSSFTTSASTRVLALVVKELLAAETLSFLYVLLVWGVNLLSLVTIYVQTMRLCFLV